MSFCPESDPTSHMALSFLHHYFLVIWNTLPSFCFPNLTWYWEDKPHYQGENVLQLMITNISFGLWLGTEMPQRESLCSLSSAKDQTDDTVILSWLLMLTWDKMQYTNFFFNRQENRYRYAKKEIWYKLGVSTDNSSFNQHSRIPVYVSSFAHVYVCVAYVFMFTCVCGCLFTCI